LDCSSAEACLPSAVVTIRRTGRGCSLRLDGGSAEKARGGQRGGTKMISGIHFILLVEGGSDFFEAPGQFSIG